jgi:hypothetical protein
MIYFEADVKSKGRCALLFTCRGILNPTEDAKQWNQRVKNFHRNMRSCYPGNVQIYLHETDISAVLALEDRKTLPNMTSGKTFYKAFALSL